MDPNAMMDTTASSPPNFGSPQSPLEMKPDPNMIAMGQGWRKLLDLWCVVYPYFNLIMHYSVFESDTDFLPKRNSLPLLASLPKSPFLTRKRCTLCIVFMGHHGCFNILTLRS